MLFRAATTSVVLSLWFFVGSVSAAGETATVPLHRIGFSAAPRQVQRDLISYFASCGVPARIVKSAASVDVGPIGGPGRTDYYFAFLGDYWKNPGNKTETFGDNCEPNHFQSIIWMQSKSGEYKFIADDDVSIYFRDARIIVVSPDQDCDSKTWSRARAWWDCVRPRTWDSKSGAFHRITGDMTLDEADAWAKARGYMVYAQ